MQDELKYEEFKEAFDFNNELKELCLKKIILAYRKRSEKVLLELSKNDKEVPNLDGSSQRAILDALIDSAYAGVEKTFNFLSDKEWNSYIEDFRSFTKKFKQDFVRAYFAGEAAYISFVSDIYKKHKDEFDKHCAEEKFNCILKDFRSVYVALTEWWLVNSIFYAVDGDIIVFEEIKCKVREILDKKRLLELAGEME